MNLHGLNSTTRRNQLQLNPKCIYQGELSQKQYILSKYFFFRYPTRKKKNKSEKENKNKILMITFCI